MDRAHFLGETTIIDKNVHQWAGVVSLGATSVLIALQTQVPDLAPLVEKAQDINSFRTARLECLGGAVGGGKP